MAKSNGKALFDDEDDVANEDYSKDFEIKEQYQGEKGARLLKLQSRFKNDKRFKMDEQFWDDEDETAGTVEEPAQQNGGGEGEDDERQWQYGILESVMGKQIQSDPASDKQRNKLVIHNNN